MKSIFGRWCAQMHEGAVLGYAAIAHTGYGNSLGLPSDPNAIRPIRVSVVSVETETTCVSPSIDIGSDKPHFPSGTLLLSADS